MSGALMARYRCTMFSGWFHAVARCSRARRRWHCSAVGSAHSSTVGNRKIGRRYRQLRPTLRHDVRINPLVLLPGNAFAAPVVQQLGRRRQQRLMFVVHAVQFAQKIRQVLTAGKDRHLRSVPQPNIQQPFDAGASQRLEEIFRRATRESDGVNRGHWPNAYPLCHCDPVLDRGVAISSP